MRIRSVLNQGAASTALALALFSAPAMAQEGATEDQVVEEEGEEDVITVTGSRIRLPNLEGSEPTTTIDRDYIDQRNFVNVADALNDLPQIRGSVTPNGGQAAFGQGVNFINNFGLGSNRTLTLINGRRVVSSNTPSLFGPGASGLQVDLNIVPTALVKQIDIVSTAGAPIYGSDAIAGTLNIILDDRYEGFSLNGTSFITEEGDNFTYRLEGVYGTSFADGRGHLQISSFYTDVTGVLGASRDFIRADLETNPNVTNVNRVNQELGLDTGPNDGIPNTAFFRNVRLPFLDNNGVLSGTNGNTFGGPGSLFSAGPLGFSPDGNLVPFEFGTGLTGIRATGGDGFRFSDFNQLTSDLRRFGANVFANYDVTDNINVFTELQYYDARADELVQQPTFNTPLFGGASGPLVFQADNPFLNDQARGVLAANGINSFTVSRANVGIADVTGFAETEFLRGVLGARGDFEVAGNDWNWETTFTYGQVEINDFRQDINVQNFINATNVTTDDAGNIVCDANPATPVQAGFAPVADPSCVPFNFFTLNNSQAAFDYVLANNNSFNSIEQIVFNANVGGTLFEFNNNPVAFNIGYEHREETADFQPSDFEVSGLGRGAAVQPVVGGFNLDEVFGELAVGLISPDNESFIYSLDLFARGRYVDNTVNGGFFSWAVGGNFAPVEDISIRANFTRSFRAPAVGELFLPQSNAFAVVPDLCFPIAQGLAAGGFNPDVRTANCQAFNDALIALGNPRDIATGPLLSSTATVPIAVGGNPNLDNEQADSWTVGAIFRPSFVPNLSITLDYINISITDNIFQFGTGALAVACFDNPDFNANDVFNANEFCSALVRDLNSPAGTPANQIGDVVTDPANPGVLTGFGNGGFLDYEGLQGTFLYSTDLSSLGIGGRLQLRGDLTVVLRREEDQNLLLGAPTQPTDGLVGDPEFSAQFTANYFGENWGFGATANYTGEQVISRQNRSADGGPSDIREFDQRDDFVVVDANLFFNTDDDFRINFVVNNLFNRQGQDLFGDLIFINDAFGRSFSVSVTKDF